MGNRAICKPRTNSARPRQDFQDTPHHLSQVRNRLLKNGQLKKPDDQNDGYKRKCAVGQGALQPFESYAKNP